MPESPSALPVETIERKVLFLRGQKVMLSRDLAVLFDDEGIASLG